MKFCCEEKIGQMAYMRLARWQMAKPWYVPYTSYVQTGSPVVYVGAPTRDRPPCDVGGHMRPREGDPSLYNSGVFVFFSVEHLRISVFLQEVFDFCEVNLFDAVSDPLRKQFWL